MAESKPHSYSDLGDCWCEPALVQPFADMQGDERQWFMGWRHNYEGHTCACKHCDPKQFELGEADYEAKPGDPHRTVLVEGRPIRFTKSLKAGDNGWVIAYSDYFDGPHVCETCFQEGCQRLLRGKVEVSEPVSA